MIILYYLMEAMAINFVELITTSTEDTMIYDLEQKRYCYVKFVSMEMWKK